MNRIKLVLEKLFLPLPGTGGIYVVLILGMIMAASYFISGGLVPKIKKVPENPQRVQIDDTSINANKDTLQLVNIQAVPSPTPTENPNPPACSEGVVVGLLVDVSGSMAGDDNDGSNTPKIDNLKQALRNFVSIVPQNTTVVNLHPFSTWSHQYVPYDYLRNNRALMDEAITALSVGREIGGEIGMVVWKGQTIRIGTSTYMKDAFEAAGPQLLQAKNSFPTGRAYMVFMSDGVPETNDCRINRTDGQYHITKEVTSPLCGVTIDTHPQNPVAASQALKDQGVKVFSVALYGEREETIDIQNAIKKVMRDTASDPDSTYYLESPTSVQLSQAFQAISQRICQ